MSDDALILRTVEETEPLNNKRGVTYRVQVVGGGSGGSLPSQTGQSGKFLTTDGTDASWSDKPLVNTATGTLALTILGTATNVPGAINIGSGSSATQANGVAVGRESEVKGAYSLALGAGAKIGSNYNQTIQLGEGTNLTQGSFQVKSYTMMSADGTIPEARLADTTNAQQGDVLTLDANGDAVWQAGGSGSSLPDQTGQSGKFLTTDGTDASWSDKPLVNTAYASYSLSLLGSPATGARSINIGNNSSTGFSTDSVAIGYNSSATSTSVAIGSGAKATGMYSIQIGYGTNPDAKTVKIYTGGANYEMMSADGTIPAARHAALPAADGTYTLQLVIADGVPTLSWVAV